MPDNSGNGVHVIVWINGPFGVGKSTLARRLAKASTSIMVLDPEIFGAILWRLVPNSPTGDYQDLPFWRSLTVQGILAMERSYAAHVVVPMAMTNHEYMDEMHGALRREGTAFRHVWLDVDEATLRERIARHISDPNDPTINKDVQDFRLQQVERCLAARQVLPPETVVLDAVANDADALVMQVRALIDGAVS